MSVEYNCELCGKNSYAVKQCASFESKYKTHIIRSKYVKTCEHCGYSRISETNDFYKNISRTNMCVLNSDEVNWIKNYEKINDKKFCEYNIKMNNSEINPENLIGGVISDEELLALINAEFDAFMEEQKQISRDRKIREREAKMAEQLIQSRTPQGRANESIARELIREMQSETRQGRINEQIAKDLLDEIKNENKKNEVIIEQNDFIDDEDEEEDEEEVEIAVNVGEIDDNLPKILPLVDYPIYQEELIRNAKQFLVDNNVDQFVYRDKGNLVGKRIFEESMIEANTFDELIEKLDLIYDNEINNGYQFKINVCLSGIGFKNTKIPVDRSVFVGGFGYINFILSNFGPNTFIFTRDAKNPEHPQGPLVINDFVDWIRFKSFINEETFVAVIINAFSQSGVSLIGCPRFYVYLTRTNIPLGCCIDLPEKIKKSKSIITMDKVKNNMCFFHCVAKGINKTIRAHRMVKRAEELFFKYHKTPNDRQKSFDFTKYDGVNIFNKRMRKFESIIEKNINFYVTDDDLNVKPEKISNGKFKETINLLRYDNHLMLITNKDHVLGKYCCKKCGMTFKDNELRLKHTNRGNCGLGLLKVNNKFINKTKIWQAKMSDLLKLFIKYDVEIPSFDELKLDNILTYDFETLSDKTKAKIVTNNLTYESEQKIVSYSISYRINGILSSIYKEINFDDEDHEVLVKNFTDTLIDLSIDSVECYKKRFKNLFEKLTEKDINRFHRYCALPCISFNGNKFDIKVVTSYGLYQNLFSNEKWIRLNNKADVNSKNILIIENQMICVNTVRMIDQRKWTPGNLDFFIKSYGPKEDLGKLKFPHIINDRYKELLPLEFNK